MSTFSHWILLLRVHSRMSRVKAAAAVRRSRLSAATVVAFLAAYLVSAYLLFSRGLTYVAALPAAGTLLTDRLIHVMFLCFMLMLVFSVAVTGYISIYRGRDTATLLTLPVSHRALFLWKCFEASVFSCWGLAFIMAPLLAAFARVREVPPGFYLNTALTLAPFLVLTSALGCLLLIAAARWLSRRQAVAGLIAAALLVAASMVRTGLEDSRVADESGLGAALTFQRVFAHTDLAVNRALPSTWMAGAVIDWSKPYRSPRDGLLHPVLLISHSLLAMLLLHAAGGAWFYRSWNRSFQHSAESAFRRSRRLAPSREQILRDYPRTPLLSRIVGRPLGAVAQKDWLTFVRDPSHWVQFALVFGLLALYATGLRRMNSDLSHPRDLYLVAFLNLTVCALALSTLTTRFVFPQFSLEGRRLWILAMSPVRMPTLVIQKFTSGTLLSGGAVVGILAVSGYNLQLGWGDSIFFAAAVALLAIGLNAIATGLGVLFPDLEETNTAKIVSGFGGTLCLVASFIYVFAFVSLLGAARWSVFRTNEVDPAWHHDPASRLAILAALTLTAATTALPLFFSRKKLKKVEILRN